MVSPQGQTEEGKNIQPANCRSEDTSCIFPSLSITSLLAVSASTHCMHFWCAAFACFFQVLHVVTPGCLLNLLWTPRFPPLNSPHHLPCFISNIPCTSWMIPTMQADTVGKRVQQCKHAQLHAKKLCCKHYMN